MTTHISNCYSHPFSISLSLILTLPKLTLHLHLSIYYIKFVGIFYIRLHGPLYVIHHTFCICISIDQTKGLEANRHRVKVYTRVDSTGPAAMFLVVLEGMVYTVGAIFAVIAIYLGMRWYRGASIPFMKAFNPESVPQSDLELSRKPSKKMPITPDAFRT